MKNKKGFTLIELVITIAIIGILLIFIVPAISKYVNKGKDDYNLNVKKNIVQIAKDYYSNNSNELPKGQLDVNNNPIYFTKLALTTLKYNNYVSEDVKDANKNSCDNSFVIVENNSGNYEYHSCMICGDVNYSSDDQVCTINLDNSSTETLPSCSVTYDNYDPNTWTNKDVVLNITGSDSNGIAYFKIDDKQILPTKNANGNYEAKYTATASGQYRFYAINKTGQRSFCDINGNPVEVKIDKDNPTCKISIVSETDKTKTIEVAGIDQISGVESIKINNVSVDFINNIGTYIVNSNGTYKAVISDLAGNTSKEECSVIVEGLDSTPPVIEFTQEGTQGEIAVSTCSDPESGIIGESVVKQTLSGTSDVTVTRTCTNNLGMSTTKSHIYKYNSCKTGSNTCSGGYVNYNCSSCYSGSNTCSYGCGQVWDSCASTTTTTTCNTCVVYTGCSSYTTRYQCCACGSGATGGTGSGGPTTGCGCYCSYQVCTAYKDTYATSCSSCGSSTSTSCQGGYVTGNCSSCYYGSNTCSYGCDSYYDSCYSGSNTCKGGWDL